MSKTVGLNKMDPEAIVCKSVTAVHIRLTRADFASEEDFQFWKEWSNSDYHNTDKAGRGFYDHCGSMKISLIGTSLTK